MVLGESKAEQGHRSGSLPTHRFGLLDCPGVVHGITARTPELPLFGNVSYMVGDDPDAVRANRNAWGRAIGFDSSRLVLARQVHGTTIQLVDEDDAGRGADSVETSIRGVDALFTGTRQLPVAVVAADCVPILVYDPFAGVVGAVHAGWRGTVDGIASEAVRQLTSSFSSRPRDLLVGLGPAICQSCYQVGPEVIERWRMNPCAGEADTVREDSSGYYFDLRAANQVQLLDAGVLPENIEVSPLCTRCANGAMFSRRGLGPKTGLFASIIMLTDSDDVVAQGES